MTRSDEPDNKSGSSDPIPGTNQTGGEPSTSRPKTEDGGRRPARVLVVDDNEDLARGMARLLEMRGHHVRIAHDGPGGIATAKEWHPEFVLLDIGLPVIDGYQVVAQLRQEERTKNAVIIAISGYGQEEDRQRSHQAGFDHHLVKPVSSSDLMKLLGDA